MDGDFLNSLQLFIYWYKSDKSSVYIKIKFPFINYELDICRFLAYQVFLWRLKKPLPGGQALSTFRTTGPGIATNPDED